MPIYSYRVISKKDNKEKKGSIEANSISHAKEMLKAEGNIVMEITEPSLVNKEINISFGKKVKLKDLSLFCKQFNSIYSSGVPLDRTLEILTTQLSNKHLKQAVSKVKDDVAKGESFDVALLKHPDVFPNIMVQMIASGLESGKLDVVLERIALQFDREDSIMGQVKKAMIYPIVVLIVTVIVIAAMLIIVVPNFVSIFEEMDMELPALTKFVVSISNALVANWIIVLFVLFMIFFGFSWYGRTYTGKKLYSVVLLKVPMVNNLIEKSNAASFARTLGTLLESGIETTQALDITAKTIPNLVFQDAIKEISKDVTEGVLMSVSIKKQTVLPLMLSQMVNIGEESGRITYMLDRLAEYYEDEVKRTTDTLVAMMEPMIIIILAVLVMGIVGAVMLPMLSMYDGLNNL